MQELIEQVVTLKSQINNLEAEYKEAISNLLQVMEGSIETESVSIAPRTTPKWQFSQKVGELEDALKKAKKQEQKDGVAIVVGETTTLVVKLK